MQNKQPKPKAKKPSLVYKPFLQGRPVSALAAKRGLKVLVYLLAFMLLYLFIGQALMFDSLPLRLLLNIAALLAVAGLMYNDGAKAGMDDVAFAEIALQRQQNGRELSKQDLDRCFHPLKGFFTAFVGVLPLLLVAIALSVTAERLVYQLGGLPSWLQGFERRADVGQALAYYQEPTKFGFVDVLRVIVRLSIFPFVNMVGPDSPDAMLLLERLSPLLVCLLPLAYGIGYTQGRTLRAKVHGAIKSDTRRRVQRQRRETKRRRQEPKQLV